MVKLDERLNRIKQQFIDRGKYFKINSGRQYGKTTTLMALAEYLKDEYIVLTMDFQMLGSTNLRYKRMFITSFIECLEDLFDEKSEVMIRLMWKRFKVSIRLNGIII